MTIAISHRNQGSGGVYTITGDTLEEVEACASEKVSDIDRYRSPMITHYVAQGEKYVAEIKYYGLD